MKSRCFKLYRPYSILFNSPNLGNFFLGLSSKRLYRSSEKEEGSRCLIFTSSTKRESRSAVTANKCTKMRDARAKSLFYQSKPISLLPFLLTSPSPLLKLPIIPPRSHKRFFKMTLLFLWWHSFEFYRLSYLFLIIILSLLYLKEFLQSLYAGC